MNTNIIVFPSRASQANATGSSAHIGARNGLHTQTAANSPVGPARPAALGLAPINTVRMRSSGGHTPVAGRMVMAGRLADVCAELNRMAALEACA
jgi:hypothetical protein